MSWAINWIEPQSSSKTVADEYKVGFMKLWNLTNWRGKQKWKFPHRENLKMTLKVKVTGMKVKVFIPSQIVNESEFKVFFPARNPGDESEWWFTIGKGTKINEKDILC